MAATTIKSAKASKARKGAKAFSVSKGEIIRQNASQTATKATLDDCYRTGGGYWASVQALRALGIGKLHPFAAILSAVKKAMGAKGWSDFAAVKPRNRKTGKDAAARALQNVSVVARKDYGQPLREVGYEVRWDGREKQAGLFKLNGKK